MITETAMDKHLMQNPPTAKYKVWNLGWRFLEKMVGRIP